MTDLEADRRTRFSRRLKIFFWICLPFALLLLVLVIMMLRDDGGNLEEHDNPNEPTYPIRF